MNIKEISKKIKSLKNTNIKESLKKIPDLKYFENKQK